jgi:hypothetical protein
MGKSIEQDNISWKPELLSSLGNTAWSMVPLIGAPTQLFVSNFFTERKFKNIEAFNKELQKKIQNLDIQLNSNFTPSDELTEIVESVYEEIQKTKANKKRTMFAIALANSIKNNKNSLNLEMEFIEILSTILYSCIHSLVNLKNNDVAAQSIQSDHTFLHSYNLIDQSIDILDNGFDVPDTVIFHFKINNRGLSFLNFIFDSENT